MARREGEEEEVDNGKQELGREEYEARGEGKRKSRIMDGK